MSFETKQNQCGFMYVQRSEFVGFDNIPYNQSSLGQFMALSIYNLSGKDSHGCIQILQLQCENCSINANHKPKKKRFIHSKHKSRQRGYYL
jgi:hypothetical protein